MVGPGKEKPAWRYSNTDMGPPSPAQGRWARWSWCSAGPGDDAAGPELPPSSVSSRSVLVIFQSIISASSLKAPLEPGCSSSGHLTLKMDGVLVLLSLAFGIAGCSGMVSVTNTRGRWPFSGLLSAVGGKE